MSATITVNEQMVIALAALANVFKNVHFAPPEVTAANATACADNVVDEAPHAPSEAVPGDGDDSDVDLLVSLASEGQCVCSCHLCACPCHARQSEAPLTTDTAVKAPTQDVAGASTGIAATPSSSRWYMVSRGRSVGVFLSWPQVAPMVVGVPSACYLRFGSQAAAQQAFNDAVGHGDVAMV